MSKTSLTERGNFANSEDGKAYREFARRLESDGIAAQRAEDLVDDQHKKALELLKPYSRIDPGKSRSLEIKADVMGVGAGIGGIGIPVWLRVWWNDHIPFGGIRKSLRRMWMEAESYRDFSGRLRALWAKIDAV
jgi:hypothetical protein